MLDTVLAWLNSPVGHVLGAPLSWAELLGFATGLWCVALVARRNVLNFPVGIANCALLLLLFAEARLYADAGLQLVFIALGLQGWWLWQRDRSSRHEAVAVTRAGRAELSRVIALCLLLAAALYLLLTWARGSVPVLDALIAALSLAAQWLLNRRKLEHWYFWITVDVISIPVYAYKELYLVALLYAVYLVLCIGGLRAWRRALADGR
jgi:nicotinamide mononucleotide transporter